MTQAQAQKAPAERLPLEREALAPNRLLSINEALGVCPTEEGKRDLIRAHERGIRFWEFHNQDSSDFDANGLRDLYESSFTDRNEAESWDLTILKRVEHLSGRMASGLPLTGATSDNYHVLVAELNGEAVGLTIFTTIPTGSESALVYSQYTAVGGEHYFHKQRGKNINCRGLGVASALTAFYLPLAQEDAMRMDARGGVIGIVGECEFSGFGRTKEQILYSYKRSKILGGIGYRGVAIETEYGLLPVHVQPKLSSGSEPMMLTLLFMPFKFAEGDQHIQAEIPKDFAFSLAMALQDQYHREGFECYANQSLLRERFEEATRALLVPLAQMPSLTEFADKDMYLNLLVERDFGSCEEQAKRIHEAFRMSD